jgi:ATP-dependent Clp protease protease subunit
MKKIIFIPTVLVLTTFSAMAQTTATAPKVENAATKNTELETITEKNTLQAEKLKAELANIRAEISRLKLERELLSEQQQIADLKQAAIEKADLKKSEDLEKKLEREAAIAKSRAALAASELSLETTQLLRKTTLQEAELAAIKTNTQRDSFADSKPVYLEKPLQDDNTLVISDRRIAFNGAVTSAQADHICDRIHYFNNKDKKLPIFIVIDSSPGGSVMAGYRILKAMEGSDAPIHVVVKSFAASMAACITTLAEESYAYPNAIILHHQISSSYFFTTMLIS